MRLKMFVEMMVIVTYNKQVMVMVVDDGCS